MSKKLVLGGIATLLICISIIVGSFIIGDAIKSANKANEKTISENQKILNLSEAATYLNMTEQNIKGIIQLEKSQISQSYTFVGKMFLYFTVGNTTYFYKDALDEWLKDVSNYHRFYNLKKGTLTIQ